MDNVSESEQTLATRFGRWIDDRLTGAGSPVEYGESSLEPGLAQALISWRDEPSAGLLRRVAAIPHGTEQTADRSKRRWRRQLALAITAIIAITLVAAVPYTRNAVAGVFGFEVASTPAVQISVQVPGSNLSTKSSASPGLGDDYLMILVELPVSVPILGSSEFETLGFLPIEPGTMLDVGDDETFAVPGGLPDGFEWRGVIRPESGNPDEHPDCDAEPCPGFTPSIGRSSWGGNGNAAVDSITPVYLVATDTSGNLLILSRVVVESGTPVSTKAFNKGARQFGMIVEPTKSDTLLTFLVADGVELTQTEGIDAVAYTGMWDVTGGWNDDDRWGNLTWEGQDAFYHLSGQNVPMEALLNLATQVGAHRSPDEAALRR